MFTTQTFQPPNLIDHRLMTWFLLIFLLTPFRSISLMALAQHHIHGNYILHYFYISANTKCKVPEGNLHEVRHEAEAGVQQHHSGGPQGVVPGTEAQGMLPGL